MRNYTYIVSEYDKPSVIARRLTGDSNRWLELMSFNTGLTPNKWIRHGNTIVPVYHLRVGQCLSIPNNWIKDIPNQLIHTTQGFIGYTDSDYKESSYFDPKHTDLKLILSSMQNVLNSSVPTSLIVYYVHLGELALYFCDSKVLKDSSNLPFNNTNATECSINAFKWLNTKGGIFKFLPGNWYDSLTESEIMKRIDKLKAKFKKNPIILKKDSAWLANIGLLNSDAYNQGYNVGYKQDGINAAQAIVSGIYTLNQDVTGVNTSDIPIVMPKLPNAPNIFVPGESFEPDWAAREAWISFWKQGWTDGYTDGFRETLANSDYGVEQKDQAETKKEDQLSTDMIKADFDILSSDLDQKQELDKDNKNNDKQDQESKDGFPWGWAIFGWVIIASGTVAYLNKDKIVSYFR